MHLTILSEDCEYVKYYDKIIPARFENKWSMLWIWLKKKRFKNHLKNWVGEKSPFSLFLPRLFLVSFFLPYPNPIYFHLEWLLKSEKLMEVEAVFLREAKDILNHTGSRRNYRAPEFHDALELHGLGVRFLICHIITMYLEWRTWSLWASVSFLK